jgi:threonine 3-dehydrogenase
LKVLVTGGTGFLGAEVVRQLLAKGNPEIDVFDINPSKKLLDEVAPKVTITRGDLGNFSHVMSIVKKSAPDVIYHLGGMLSVPSDEDPQAAFRVNAMGTYHVLEAARLYDVPKVLFSSTIGTYGRDIREDCRDDYTLQRPLLFYGCTKVFSELMGLFYKRKYNIDFRGLRYPSLIGPGVKTPGIVQYNAWVIEECFKGKPYSIYVRPDSRCPVMYVKDAAKAITSLAEAPMDRIKMVNYIVCSQKQDSSAEELAEMVRRKIPGAVIDFKVDQGIQRIIDTIKGQFDDRVAREEWGWAPDFYTLEKMVDDFILELKKNPHRYT